MPRFVVETTWTSNEQLDAAVQLFPARFPEISVERRYTTHDDHQPAVLWVCSAPSEAHLGRWATSAGLAIASLRRVDTHPLGAEGEG